MNRRLLLSLVASTLTLTVQAADEPLPLWKPKVKTLAAFKNGLGFVVKAGEAQLQNGWTAIDEFPAAALGTLWIATASTTEPVTDVIAYSDKSTVEQEAITLVELLSANVGKRAAITYQVGTAPTRVEGVIVAVPSDRKPVEPPITMGDSPYRAHGMAFPGLHARGSEIVLLRLDNTPAGGVVSINKSAIQAVEGLEAASLKATVTNEVPRLKVHVAKNPRTADLSMAYLEKGIVWSPSYRVNIAKNGEAEIALDAVLANDVEDLQDTEVSFVVGYPNFLYADIASPLSMRQPVAAFIQALTAERGASRFNPMANVMAQSMAYNNANFDTSTRPEMAYPAGEPMPGERAEDLYFYKKPGVTLKKGDRARYVIFDAKVPYDHMYEWNVPDSMNVSDQGYQQRNPNDRSEPENRVWHVVRLENTTTHPWTTAPAFAVNGSLPVAQDVLKYTPPRSKNTLKLTVATDVRAERSLTETSRKNTTIGRRTFDEVSVAGQLKVINWKSTDALMSVRATVIGDVLDAPEGKTTKVARNITAVNPTSEIVWEFTLPAGKPKELQYHYKVLVDR